MKIFSETSFKPNLLNKTYFNDVLGDKIKAWL